MSDSPHLLILASAGTGKTYRLTNRFLALLHQGVEPERILEQPVAHGTAGTASFAGKARGFGQRASCTARVLALPPNGSVVEQRGPPPSPLRQQRLMPEG